MSRFRGGALVLALACTSAPAPDDDTDAPPVVDTDTDDDTESVTETGEDPRLTEEERALLGLGPTVWLRVGDLVASNGLAVDVWPGVGRTADAVQVQRYRQPLVRVGLSGPLPVVRFDGEDDRLDLGDVGVRAGAGGRFSIVAVLATQAGGGHVVGVGPSRSGFGRAASAALVVEQGGPALAAGGPSGGLFVPGPAGALSDGAFHVVTVVVRPPVSTVFLDGKVVAIGEARPGELADVLATVGAGDGEGLDYGQDPLAFDLREVVVVPRALTTCERWLVERTLAAGTGLEVAQELVPPYLRFVADDVVAEGAAPIASWPARVAYAGPIGPLRAVSEAAQPVGVMDGHAWVRFDGVDDHLALPVNVFVPPYAPALSTAVVLRTTARSGFLVGAGPSVGSDLGRYGVGFVVDEGRARFVASDGTLGAEATHPAALDDGEPHVLLSTMGPEDLTLFVDEGSTPGGGLPGSLPFSRATVGGSDGAATGTARDPLAMDLAELRVYRYTLDGCAVEAVRRELATAHGVPL